MDHALWPLMTTKLYIQQTGDIEILNQQVPYFKDRQVQRGTALDGLWNESYGSRQLTENHQVYAGSILEHLFIQHLTAFYEVGNHNIYRLRDADWNDALDMASEHGESVAFTCAYAGSLLELASLIRLLDDCSQEHTAMLLEEIEVLLCNDLEAYDDVSRKQSILADYTSLCKHNIAGKRISFSLSSLAVNLTQKATWLMDHIRTQEWLEGTERGDPAAAPHTPRRRRMILDRLQYISSGFHSWKAASFLFRVPHLTGQHT